MVHLSCFFGKYDGQAEELLVYITDMCTCVADPLVYVVIYFNSTSNS